MRLLEGLTTLLVFSLITGYCVVLIAVAGLDELGPDTRFALLGVAFTVAFGALLAWYLIVIQRVALGGRAA